MELAVNDLFIKELNLNIRIAQKIARAYFPDSDDRQDALQEMMYQLWRSFPGFDGRSKFSTWMYRVCLNTALTYKHKNRNRNEILATAHQQIADEPALSNKDATDELFEAIALLSPVNKAIILLHLDGMSYDEIAAITGLTKTNVSVKLVRIRKELEERLKRNDK